MRRFIFILLAMIGVSQAQTIQYIGAPTTTVISRGNFRTDSIFYLPKRSKAPTDTAAFRYQISDSSLYVWTGSQWIKVGGSGTITGSGITGYLPQFSASTTLDTSALFTLGNRLGIGTSTFAYNSTNTANMELNGTAGGILGFKRNDSARGYLWHTGDNMELANTAAGSISFNTNSATRGSISSAGVWRLHNLAGTGDRVVVASSNGTLSASASVTGLVDTTTISTRAWRQKGDDSLGAIIATKGSGTVTSVATGYGLSGGTITTTGTLLVDTLNIATRAWRQKGLDSLAALEVSGSGTTNYVPKFTAGSTIGNSQIFDDGTSVGVSTTSPNIYSSGAYKYLTVSNNAASGYSFVTVAGGAGGGGEIDFGNQTIKHAAIASLDGSNFGIYTNNTNSGTGVTERLRITSGGDVGIGTTTPGSILDVRSSGYNIIRSTGGNGGYFDAYNTSGTRLASFGAESGGDVYFGSRGSSPVIAITNSTERLRIFANGRIGINTTTDAGYQLDINGTLRSVNGANFATTSGNVGIGTASPVGDGTALNIYGSSFATIKLQNSTSGATATDGTDILVASSDLLIKNRESGSIITYTANTERGRINAAGEWILNADGTDAGDYKLQVAGNIYNTGSAVLAATSGEAYIGTTSDAGNYKLQVSGQAFIRNTGTSGALYLDSTSLSIDEVKDRHAILITGHSLTGAEIQGPIYVGTNWNTSSDVSAIEVALTNTASGANSNLMKLSDGTNTFRVTKDAGIFTAAPSGGTARKWKLGSVVATTVILDTANYVEVEINGVAYKLALATPN